MTNYLISWDIEIEADSPQRAAELALETMQDPTSIATVFLVRGDDDSSVTIDLAGPTA